MILAADLHLTDSADDEYRWLVFAEMGLLCVERAQDRIVILGDITDRKDRHSAKLVNRLVHELLQLRDCRGPDKPHVAIHIIMGNHDQPLNGTPFWTFLDHLEHIYFYAEPTVTEDNLMMLPYAKDPAVAWAEWDFSDCAAVFMHQTVTGVIENGHELSNPNMPELPNNVPIYSGDIHTHQKVGPVQYVGAPHPVKFGDAYDCRVLIVDDRSYEITRVEMLDPPWKHMIDIRDLAELDTIDARPGDQARIRFRISISHMEQWPAIKEALVAWAQERGVRLASAEAIIEHPGNAGELPGDEQARPTEYLDADAALVAFAEAEALPASMLVLGQELLAAAIAQSQSL